MTVYDATVQILKEAGRPLHVNEISKRIIEAGLWITQGKTPEASVGACLYSDTKKRGNQSTFVKVRPRTFVLREAQIVADFAAKNPESRNVNLSVNPEETYSFLDAAEKVLDQFGNRQPMHYREITDKATNQGWLNTSGKTPEATMNAQLGTELKRAEASGKPGRFVRTSPGHYSLVKWNLNPPVNPEETYSFLDAAEKVLDQFGNRKPMHYREITDKARNQGWLHTSGKTPEATMNAQLVTELKRAKASGGPGRFIRTSPGHYSLVRWTGTGLPQQIAKHNRKIRNKLLSLLMSLNPTQFEELVGQLLAEMGFESIEVTKSGADGGIDARGTLLISDVVRIKMAVQAKRWQNNIQRPIVQQVRGSLGVHEQGLIITTSDFSKGAIKEANESDKTPVGLMNGEQLATLLMEYNIGVRRTSHRLFELGELPVAEKQK